MRLILTILAVLLISPAMVSSAQEDVNIDALAEQLASVDSERLMMGLNTPIPDDQLTGPFSDARPMDPESLAQQRATFNETLDGLTGSVVYTIDYAPQAISASPAATAFAAPSGTPAGRSQQALFSSGTLTYLVFGAPVDHADMDAFGNAMQAAMGSEAQEGTVEQITVNDVPAVLISTMTVVNAVELHAQWIAVPVGNVVVVGMVMTGTGAFVEEAFIADNEALVLSGIAWLQTIASE